MSASEFTAAKTSRIEPVVTVYFGLGSNIQPVENLKMAVAELRSTFGAVALSSAYRNKALGFEGDDFLNLVARVDTDLSASAVCDVLQQIHDKSSRARGSKKFVSRQLDIDLLLYGDLIDHESPLHVPRSDILEYSFVLVPLVEIAGDHLHPVSGRSFASHLHEFDLSRHPLTKMDVSL